MPAITVIKKKVHLIARALKNLRNFGSFVIIVDTSLDLVTRNADGFLV